MFEQANWIWKSGERRPINEHILFRKTFTYEAEVFNKAILSISADTKFRLWINGTELGEGPIRSTADHWYYDEFEMTHLLRTGTNVIAAQVWHYGHSSYQYIENEAGLITELSLYGAAGIQVIGTDETWLCCRHEGYEVDVVKRNVNLGWMEICDANALSEQWVLPVYDDRSWVQSEVVAPYGGGPWGGLYPRVIEPLSTQIVRPKQILALSEIVPIRQVISVQMRDNLYPDSRDANAKIFSGFLAVRLVVDAETHGRLTFAHSKWNGVQGRFKIDDRWYAHQDEVQLAAGDHLFMMEICGVHNDLFCHMEFDFDRELQFAHPNGDDSDAAFVTIGPIETIESYADGFQPVYGGVEKRTGLNHDHPLLVEIGACSTLEAFGAYHEMWKDVDPRHVLVNQMIYSLMMRKRCVKHYPITNRIERMLHDHLLPTELPRTVEGGDLEIVLDFGKIYVGTIELEVDAPQGTVIDVYGFENRVSGVNAYTSGCNNAFRYICREGRQVFKSFTRMGFRYVIVAVRQADTQIRIHRIQLHQSSYPATDKALFRCSDPLLNDIWEISRHTSHMCMEDTFVDCPTYEQVFWVGDCRVSALVNYQLFGSYELVRHCLEMVPRSRSQSPLLLALFPTDWQAAIPMWTFSWIIACKEYVDYSGDRSFFEAIYPEIRLTLEAYRGFLNEDGLFDTSSWNMLDWAPIDIPTVGVVTAQQAQLAQCHRIAAEMAESLGLQGEAEELLQRAEQLKRAIDEHLWNEEARVYLDGIHRNGKPSTTTSLQTHVLLYLADCIGERQAAIIEPQLLNPPKEWVQIGTPFFSFYLFEVWKRFGELDRTLAQIKTDWGQMIRYGATTTWEAFQVFPRSHAHAWSAAPAYVLGNQLLGIENVESGYRKIRIVPPVTELLWAEGSLLTAYGRIDVSWSKEAGKHVMHVAVPLDIQVEAAHEHLPDWDIQIHTIG